MEGGERQDSMEEEGEGMTFSLFSMEFERKGRSTERFESLESFLCCSEAVERVSLTEFDIELN